MGTKPFYRRRFLNRRGHHAGAYVLAECAVETDRDRTALESYLTISDCGRTVTLDFSGTTRSELGNALFKARTLRDTLVDLTATLEGSADEMLAS